MPLIQLPRAEDDDPAFVFRVEHIFVGAVRFARPKHAHFTKIDNWFGVRWLCFAGNKRGKDIHEEDHLCVPPFAPKRVMAERTYCRHEQELERVKPIRLHDKPATATEPLRYLDAIHASGLFCWHSGNTANQDRGSVMVYEVIEGEPQRAWHAEFQKRDGVWAVSSRVGTSTRELADLETSYEDRLEPLFQHSRDIKKQQVKKLWNKVLAMSFDDGAVGQATVLISQYRAECPDNKYGRLINGRVLAQRRMFDEAEIEFRAIEGEMGGDKQRSIWLDEWATASELRGDLRSAESAYRELASNTPDETKHWVFLGGCLARQGKLEEAEAIHRQATELKGDPDEAYLNLGLVLRAQGRLQESAAAFGSALELCPDYTAASNALADVEAAIAIVAEKH
tara:strand:- start:22810 stop:23994 length:1185 start_codon:yes stop_codon:yes gene_type:complete